MMSSRKVPYVQIALQHQPLKQDLMDAAARVIDHGQFVLGPEVDEFERAFAAYCGVPFAAGLNSGTDALVLALRVLNIGPGDEVITVPNTFVATVSAIRLVGARPVLVDAGDDGNMDVDRLDDVVSPRTRCIIPVHLTGRPVRMDRVMALAGERGLQVVEDAAQAVGARYQGRPVGSFGHAGCFSLHPLKTLNACGDGGVITLRDQELYDRIKLLRNLGLKRREDAVVWSGNSRLDTLQAAFLLVKLGHLNAWTEARRQHAAWYRLLLQDVPDIRLPPDDVDAYSVYHTFVVQAEERDRLKDALERRGVGTAVHYPIPVHLQSVGQDLGYKRGAFPVAERQAESILSLPIHQDLSRDDVEYVAACIHEFYGH